MTDTNAQRSFSKTVAIKATDDEERISTGLVLTTNEVDHQLDWLDEDGIRAMYNPDPADGVMHAVHPVNDSSLEFNEVLDEDQTIDGAEFSAGDWVIRRKYTDDARWNLVKDGTLGAYSIGGTVTDAEPYESIEDLPDDVTIPPAVDPDSVPEKYWPPSKITDGEVTEISDVDVGAVVSADHAVVKSLGEVQKDVLAETDGREEFVAVMEARGATADGAEALYEYMTAAEVDADDGKTAETTSAEADAGTGSETDTPDDTMSNSDDDSTDIEDVDDATLGKRLKRILLGTDEDDVSKDASTDDGDSVDLPEVAGSDVSKALLVAKEGRSLNEQNRSRLMAAHDAIEMALDGEVEFMPNRFTDDSAFEFSLADYDGKAAPAGGTEKSFAEFVDKELTNEQTMLVGQAIREFVDAQGEADVGVLHEWLWNKGDDLDPDIKTALEVALDEFWADQHPDNQSVAGGFADWVSEQADGMTIELMTDDSTTDDGQSLAEQNSERLDSIEAKLDKALDTGEDDDAEKSLSEQVENLNKRINEMESDDDTEKSLSEQVADLNARIDEMASGDDTEKSLSEQVAELNDRVEAVSKATAGTQQAGGAEQTGETEGQGTWTNKNSPFAAGGGR